MKVPGCDIPYIVSGADDYGNQVQVPDDGGTGLTAWGPDTQGHDVCHGLCDPKSGTCKRAVAMIHPAAVTGSESPISSLVHQHRWF